MERIVGERYRLIRPIGEGGTGKVWLAEDLRLGRKWAVKEIPLPLAGSWKRRSAEGEFTALCNKKHKGLPFIADCIREEGAYYLIQEYIEGISLEEYLKAEGRVSAGTAVSWMRELTETVRYLHELHPPVFHLDIKPSNIMICPDGSLMLIDFGAAGAGYCGRDCQRLGTYGYAAPEQCAREAEEGGADARSDIYALGAVLYRMASGVDPSSPPYGVTEERKKALPDAFIKKVVSRCVREKPQERYQSAKELYRELLRYEKRPRLRFFDAADRSAYRQEKAVFYTGKKRVGLFLCLLTAILLAAPAGTLRAGVRPAPLTVALSGEAGRRLLLKENSRLIFKGDLDLVIPEEYFEPGEPVRVEVSVIPDGPGQTRKKTVLVQKAP